MCNRGLIKATDDTMWIVANRGLDNAQFSIEYGPTTKEDAEYYQGHNIRYELIELKVVSRTRPDYIDSLTNMFIKKED